MFGKSAISIGRGSHLPGYIAENHGIAALERNHNTGKPYEDNLCFFHCLALHNGCHTKNLERDTQYYYQQYRNAELGKNKFHCVKLSELDQLEKVYEVNIQVYSLAPTQTHGTTVEDDDNEENRPDIAATLIQSIYDLFHISLTFISFTGTYEPTTDLLPT